MRITCPFCFSEATLHPNPAQDERGSLPRYLRRCSGCVRTSVRQEIQELPLAALVRNHHGNRSCQLAVAADGVRSSTPRTDLTRRTVSNLGHSELMEYVVSRFGSCSTFSLILRTVDEGSPGLCPQGGIDYLAVRGWVVTNGEALALTGQEVWEATARDFESREALDWGGGFGTRP